MSKYLVVEAEWLEKTFPSWPHMIKPDGVFQAEIHPDSATGLADAHLIATAPELYDALEEAVIALEIVHNMHRMTETELLTHLKSVLAKARGEQHE